MSNRFWIQAAGAFFAAGLWLFLYFWFKRSIGFGTRLGSIALLGLMVSAILVPILWVTVKNRHAPK